jgi:hypothetical protein
MDKPRLLDTLNALHTSRKEMSKYNFALCTDNALALEMITLIRDAFRNGVIRFGEMQQLLYTHIISC